jgi:GT2 family glycosyltransferase
MVRRSAFDKVGGFDVAYTPAGCEEIDFSFALRQAGYKCLAVPHLDVNHHGLLGVSSRDIDIEFLSSTIKTGELDVRNRAILKNKWHESAE